MLMLGVDGGCQPHVHWMSTADEVFHQYVRQPEQCGMRSQFCFYLLLPNCQRRHVSMPPEFRYGGGMSMSPWKARRARLGSGCKSDIVVPWSMVTDTTNIKKNE